MKVSSKVGVRIRFTNKAMATHTNGEKHIPATSGAKHPAHLLEKTEIARPVLHRFVVHVGSEVVKHMQQTKNRHNTIKHILA